MGTRADFYVGKGKDAEWIGSTAWGGYRDGIDEAVLNAHTESDFRSAIEAFFAPRNDVTRPADGWPWPWNTSKTSDCSYWFFEGRCWDAQGSPDVYVPCDEQQPEWGNDDEEELQDKWLANREQIDFPDMSERKNVTYGQRSGLIVLTAR